MRSNSEHSDVDELLAKRLDHKEDKIRSQVRKTVAAALIGFTTMLPMKKAAEHFYPDLFDKTGTESVFMNQNPEALHLQAIEVFNDKFSQGRAEAWMDTAVIHADGVELNPFVVSLKGAGGHDYLMRYHEENGNFSPINLDTARVVYKIQKGGEGPKVIQGKFNWVEPTAEEPGYFQYEDKQIGVGRVIPINGTERGIEIAQNMGFNVSRFKPELGAESITGNA